MEKIETWPGAGERHWMKVMFYIPLSRSLTFFLSLAKSKKPTTLHI